MKVPRVAPELYDADYYLHVAAGALEWSESRGSAFHGVYAAALDKAGLNRGDVVVDVGTGRGELLALAVARGADRAIGVEYSPAAVELARQTLAANPTAGRAEVVHADARALPLPDATADLVTMLDVVEHLTSDELSDALREVHRILRPGGLLLAHTMPNRDIYTVTYRLQRGLVPTRWRAWPRDPRNDFEHRMHVGELNLGSLRRALRRAGFAGARAELGEWIYADFVPDDRARVLYHRLAAHRPTARFGVADLWGLGRR